MRNILWSGFALTKRHAARARHEWLPWTLASRRRTAAAAGTLFLFVCFLIAQARQAAAPGGPSSQPRTASVEVVTTDPATTQPAAGDNQMFDPSAQGADPSWSMPVELSNDQVQSLVRQVDRLQKDLQRVAARTQAGYDDLNVFGAQDLRQALWQRLTSGGFKDAKVPLLYYEVMKDEVGLLNAMATEAAKFADRGALEVINNRIAAAQVRLFGGRCVMGDQLFVKAMTSLVASRHAHYDEMEPKRKELAFRLAREFPQFEQFRRNIVGNENPYLRLPGSEGYQRLPGATRD